MNSKIHFIHQSIFCIKYQIHQINYMQKKQHINTHCWFYIYLLSNVTLWLAARWLKYYRMSSRPFTRSTACGKSISVKFISAITVGGNLNQSSSSLVRKYQVSKLIFGVWINFCASKASSRRSNHANANNTWNCVGVKVRQSQATNEIVSTWKFVDASEIWNIWNKKKYEKNKFSL